MSDSSNPLHDMNGFQRDVLVVISSCEEAPFGVTIKNELEDHYGHEVNEGRLYPNLNKLQEKGFLEKVPVDNRANEYTLTSEGMRCVTILSEWIKERTDDFNQNQSESSLHPA